MSKGIPLAKCLQVKCEPCGNSYEIEYSKSRKTLNKLIDYSICPNCGVPRNPHMHSPVKPECSVCHVPVKKLGLCSLHYMREYKTRRFLLVRVSIKSSVIRFTHG